LFVLPYDLDAVYIIFLVFNLIIPQWRSQDFSKGWFWRGPRPPEVIGRLGPSLQRRPAAGGKRSGGGALSVAIFR